MALQRQRSGTRSSMLREADEERQANRFKLTSWLYTDQATISDHGPSTLHSTAVSSGPTTAPPSYGPRSEATSRSNRESDTFSEDPVPEEPSDTKEIRRKPVPESSYEGPSPT